MQNVKRTANLQIKYDKEVEVVWENRTQGSNNITVKEICILLARRNDLSVLLT